MNFIKLEALLWRYRRLLSLLIVVFIVQFFELILLHFKYTTFTGGFLQQFSYQTSYDRLVFILLSFWFDTILFGLLALIWFHFSDKLHKNGLVSYYNYIVFSVLIMGCWLGLKFEVLSYFNDTINFQIIKNIGGGSLRSALLYVSNEITLVVSIILAVFFMVVIGGRVVVQFQYAHTVDIDKIKSARLYPIFFIALLLTPIVTFVISENEFLRYGMQKKTSYQLINHVLDNLSDFDSDGFGVFSNPRDKDNFNSSLYPGALDIPGNGIDEDGFLGDALMPAPSEDRLKAINPEKGKHIILIVLESARADLLEKKVRGQYVAPVLREIAEKGTSINNAYSHTGYTVTSLNAIFNRSLTGKNDNNLLAFLRKAKYQISIVSGQDESFGGVATSTGMKEEGVSYFDARTAIDDRVYVSKESGSLRLSEERVVKQFEVRAAELDYTEPQFIYLNFQAAHFPYSHPKMVKRITQHLIPRSEINISNKARVEDAYWNAIANADWAVGEIFKMLEQYDILDNTTVVLLGDHGESLFDNGFLGHGYAINEIQTRIPLIINDPNIVVTEAIGQIDVAEIAIRSALGLKNRWDNKGKVVFQLVGSLNRPVLIAHVGNGGQRTLFDFRTERVFFSELKLWKSYEEAIDDSKFKHRLETLIRHWESLRWKAHLLRRK